MGSSACSFADMTSRLEPERAGSVNFLSRLPTEIRNAIYELVLLFPKSGVRLLDASKESEDNGGFGFFHRDLKRGADSIGPRPVALRPAQPDRLLALLATNQQIFKEAMPIFYGCNTFVCDSTATLFRFMQSTGFNRLKHIKTVRMNIIPTSLFSKDNNMRSDGDDINELLSTMTLDSLEVQFGDPSNAWFLAQMPANYRGKSNSINIASIPASRLIELRQLAFLGSTAPSLKVEGQYDQLVKWFKEQVEDVLERTGLREKDHGPVVVLTDPVRTNGAAVSGPGDRRLLWGDEIPDRVISKW
jgi:hypothetical protein